MPPESIDNRYDNSDLKVFLIPVPYIQYLLGPAETV